MALYSLAEGVDLGPLPDQAIGQKLEPLWIELAILAEHLLETMWRVRMPSGRIVLTHTNAI